MRKSLVLGALYAVLLADSAHAYLDPGTGAIILQGIVAAAATGLFFMRTKVRALANLLTGRKKPERGHDEFED